MSSELRSGEPPGAGLLRILHEQLSRAADRMTAALSPPESAEDDTAEAVHEARKALKRTRAVLRLLRCALGEAAFQRENERARAIGRQLAPIRDAQAMLDALDALLAREGGASVAEVIGPMCLAAESLLVRWGS